MSLCRYLVVYNPPLIAGLPFARTITEMPFTILAGSYTNDIYTLLFDPGAGSLILKSSLKVGHHPSWVEAHPGDHSLVFAGLEQADGKILAVKYDEEGNGKVVAEASSGGKDPCHQVVVGDELAIANVRRFVLPIPDLT